MNKANGQTCYNSSCDTSVLRKKFILSVTSTVRAHCPVTLIRKNKNTYVDSQIDACISVEFVLSPSPEMKHAHLECRSEAKLNYWSSICQTNYIIYTSCVKTIHVSFCQINSSQELLYDTPGQTQRIDR